MSQYRKGTIFVKVDLVSDNFPSFHLVYEEEGVPPNQEVSIILLRKTLSSYTPFSSLAQIPMHQTSILSLLHGALSPDDFVTRVSSYGPRSPVTERIRAVELEFLATFMTLDEYFAVPYHGVPEETIRLLLDLQRELYAFGVSPANPDTGFDRGL